MNTRNDNTGFGQEVELRVQFRDNTRTIVDLDNIPTITITEPDGTIMLPTTSLGVTRISTGLYSYVFMVPLNGPEGRWFDVWNGTLSGVNVEGICAFNIYNYAFYPNPIDGYAQLGDEPDIRLSQEAIKNLNRLIKLLRLRLQSSGRHQIKNEYGGIEYENCEIFSVDELYAFLCSSLAEFNLYPHPTGFTWEDPFVVDDFADILVEGAYIMALGSKALIEKGREYNITDNGISFQPAAVADFLNSQMNSLLGPYREKLKTIKAQFKPSPIGLGTLRITAVAPQYLRLRHRRENRVI